MQLTVTRRVGESIWIGDVRLTVRELTGNRVEFVVLAPRGIQVDRGEVRDRVEKARNS